MIDKYIWFFFIYALLGWCLEVIYHLFTDKSFINRGFLTGPYCPIYGFGAIIEIYYLSPFLKQPLILFLISIVITTVLEFITGYILEKIFNLQWWDYKTEKFNLYGYICVKFSFLWGIASLIIMYGIQPIIFNIVKLLYPLNNFIYVFIIIIIIDFFTTVYKIILIKNEINILLKIDKDIKLIKLILKHRLSKKSKRLLKSYPKLIKIIEKIKTIKEAQNKK